MRVRRVPPPSFLILALLGIGCVYYNGLYNANQLAGEARKAEREGRRGEAQSLWAQAAVKAESVATRYPDSKHFDDALLMQGRALSEIGECRDAIVPLRQAVDVSADVALRAEAGLLLGECHLSLGRADSAWAILTSLVTHPDSAVASRAHLWRGRAALAGRRPGDALADLDRTTEADAWFDRAEALTVLGRVRDASTALDSARLMSFDEARWTHVLAKLGAADPSAASRLVDGLLSRDDLTSGEKARLLMADAQRWQLVDGAHAVERFSTAVSMAGDSLERHVARAHLAIAEVRRTTDLDRITELADEMGDLMLEGGEVVNLAGDFATILDRIVFAVGPPEPIHPDLHLFRSAEEARDSLLARPLAARLFLTVAERYPTSVIAPKALLAAAMVREEVADSVQGVLRRLYAWSPYTRAAAGDFIPQYTHIEDSIRTLLNDVIIRTP